MAQRPAPSARLVVEAVEKPGPDPVGAMTAADGSRAAGAVQHFAAHDGHHRTDRGDAALCGHGHRQAVPGRVPGAAIVAELTEGLDSS